MPLKTIASAAALALGQELGRELGARSVLFHQAVAERLGIGATEHKCLDIAHRAGRDHHVTAGELAGLTGLTTGAITGVLDRLEKAGFVRREKDPGDRRQVLVRVVPDREREIDALSEPMARAWAELCSRYDEDQLTMILDFARGAVRLLEQETEKLRAHAAAAPSEQAPVETREISIPIGSVTRGRLELSRGAANLEIGAGPSGSLCQGRFEGWLPKVGHRDGKVTVEYANSVLNILSFRRSSASIALSPSVPWALAVRGGASNLKGRLKSLEIAGVDIAGGLSDVAFQLPRPRGTVPIRVTGGVSDVRIVRPAGVPARVRVDSGASSLAIDTLHLGAVGGETRWESPDYAGAADRYDIEIRGGASNLKVTTDALAPEPI